jgi:outer membrane protein assembly factor BamB
MMKIFFRSVLGVGSLLAGLALISSTVASDWPTWRGADRAGLSQESGLLKSWPAAGPKQVWLYRNAGEGYSGPAIFEGKLYIMGTRNDNESLLALKADTGEELWQTGFVPIFRERRGNGPRSTPTIDVEGRHIYAISSHGKLVCASLADGKVVWQQSFTDLGGKRPNWGFSESPLIDGDKVICTPGGSQGALAAFDKRTGKLLWRSASFSDDAQYSSIVPADIHGVRQYIQLTQPSLVGINATDGKLLWKSPWSGRTAVIPTPIVSKDYVYITSGYGAGCKLVKVYPNNSVTDVYENKVMKNHHGGVVKIGNYIYGHSDQVGWVCQNFMTGEEVWSDKKLGKGAVAAADGMLYCVDESNGTVALVTASPKGWSEQGRFKLSPQSTTRPSEGRIWTHPVIANGKLYLRDQELVFCYDVSAK